MEGKNGNCKYLNPSNAELNPICHLLALLGAHPILHVSRIRVKYVPVLQFADCVTGQVICSNKSYRNDQQDATVLDNLLFHCSLTAQHVSSIITVHHQELLNCNYSFWFYSHLSLLATVMTVASNDKHE